LSPKTASRKAMSNGIYQTNGLSPNIKKQKGHHFKNRGLKFNMNGYL